MGQADKTGRLIRSLIDETALASKVGSDPRIGKIVAKNIGGLDPQLAARVKAGDPTAVLEAYQAVVAGGGRLPARQMELPLGDDPGTAMIPYGVRGPGEPGSLSAPGVTQSPGTALIPAPLRGMPGSGPRRIGTTAGVPGDLSGPGVLHGDPEWNRMVDEWNSARPFENNTPLRMRAGMNRALSTEVRLPRLTDENSFDAAATRWADSMDPSGVQSPPPGASPGWKQLAGAANSPAGRRIAAAAGIAGAGIGGWNMFPRDEDAEGEGITDTSGTEDLAAESRPAPSVEPSMPPEEQEFADRFKRQYLAREAKRNAPVDYSFQAREMIGKLNAMRREAGGEVPEAKAMMAEINRLLELSNKQKNAPGYEPPMPTDYHGEAQRLLQKLNAHRMEVGGEVPETQQVMAEVRRLQALGDQQRNAR